MKNKLNKNKALAWLKIASEDLLWGRDDFKNSWYSRVCFISQQAVEKALKSYLIFNS